MTKTPSKLTVDQQLLVSAVADEITETTSIHQQAIVRMLAVASEHNLNSANLLQDLGVEIKSKTTRKLPFVVHDLKAGLSIDDALARTPGIVPESTLLALATANSRGLQRPLNHALLNTTNKRESENNGEENLEAVDRVSKLIQKFIFVFSILTFMMLFIIPQFKMMYNEFGMELPTSMSLLINFSNFMTQFWFVFALALIAIGVYFVCKHPRVISSYFTRWIPNRWQQPVLTKRTKQDLSVAWVVQASDDLPDAALQFINNRGIDSDELNRSAAAAKSGPDSGFLETLKSKRIISNRVASAASTASSNDSAAWILRKISEENQTTRRRRNFAGLRILIWVGNFLLMLLVGLTAIAIFQSLLCIIRGLS